jgi:hypothetical protein
VSTVANKIQMKLDSLTKKWWFYLLLLLPIFIRPYVTEGYTADQTVDVIMQALSKPLIYSVPIFFPIAKAALIILITGVMVLGNRVRRAFNIYFALLFLAIAIFQNAGQTETYGLVVTTGNLILILIVALVWVWEVFVERNDFEPRRIPAWRWWVVPLAAFALLAPVDSITLTPDFSLVRLLTSEAGLTNCMVLPVILSILTLYFPTVNLSVLRIMGFAGIYFGLLNVVIWFFVFSYGWWMGVLHIPLLLISIFAFILGHQKVAVKR